MENALAKNRHEIYYHAQVGLPDKDCDIKELVVKRKFDQKSCTSWHDWILKYIKIAPSGISRPCRTRYQIILLDQVPFQV